MNARRDFLKKSILTIGGTAIGTSLLHAEDFSDGAARGGINIQPNDVILFQGDSITDAGRNKENLQANDMKAFRIGLCHDCRRCAAQQVCSKKCESL